MGCKEEKNVAINTAEISKNNRPNIIVIIADDTGYIDSGFMGSKDLTVAPHRPCTPPDFIKGVSQAGERGDMVAEFDWTVGEIMKKLDQLGIRENTILIVSSDNGGTLTSDDGKDYGHKSCEELRGHKGSLYEGGHRVPFIVSWTNKVKANTQSDALINIMDLYPTFSNLLGTPDFEGDGISFLQILNYGKEERIHNKHKNHNDMAYLQVGFIAVNKKGAHAGYSLRSGFNYAVYDEEKGNRMEDAQFKMSWDN